MDQGISKDWVTHEAHRVFEEEFARHAALIKETIRQTMKEELHPKHGEHHIVYANDLDMRNNVKRGALGSLGGMLMQAVVIGAVISAALYIKGAGL